jgi:hypothetical protein
LIIMPVRIGLLALSAVLIAVQPSAAKDKAKSPPAEQFLCEGIFGADTTDARLREHFGADNVVTGTIYGPEGMELLGTTIYPDDPTRKMEVLWYDEENLAYPSNIDLSPSQVAPGGVRVGMSIDEVEALNGQPFKLGGFWWDYGGYAWIEVGNLFEPDPNCHVGYRFSPADDYPETIDTTSVAGDIELNSDMPLLDEIGTRVTHVSVGYPWPDHIPLPEY